MLRSRSNARFMLIEIVTKYYSRNLERKFTQVSAIMHGKCAVKFYIRLAFEFQTHEFPHNFSHL